MVLLDAAKGCGTAPPDLTHFPADFVAISFYKVNTHSNRYKQSSLNFWHYWKIVFSIFFIIQFFDIMFFEKDLSSQGSKFHWGCKFETKGGKSFHVVLTNLVYFWQIFGYPTGLGALLVRKGKDTFIVPCFAFRNSCICADAFLESCLRIWKVLVITYFHSS